MNFCVVKVYKIKLFLIYWNFDWELYKLENEINWVRNGYFESIYFY